MSEIQTNTLTKLIITEYPSSTAIVFNVHLHPIWKFNYQAYKPLFNGLIVVRGDPLKPIVPRCGRSIFEL